MLETPRWSSPAGDSGKFYQGVLMVELVQIGPSRSPYAISQDEPAPTVVADTSGDSVEPTQPIPIITPDSKLSDDTAIATRPRRSARLSSARVSRDATRPGATPAEQISPQSADTTPTTAHPAGPGAGPDTTVAATADGPHTAKPTEYSTFQPVRSGYLAAADEASRTAASKFPALPVRMLFGHTDPFNDKLLAIPHDNGEPSYVDVDTAAVWAKAVAPGKPWWLMTCGAKRLAEAFQSKGITAMYLDGVIHQTEKGISTGPLKRKGLEVDLTLPLPEESERWIILWGDGTKTDYATWQEALRALIPDLDDDLLELVRKATINPGHIAWILAGPTRRSPA